MNVINFQSSHQWFISIFVSQSFLVSKLQQVWHVLPFCVQSSACLSSLGSGPDKMATFALQPRAQKLGSSAWVATKRHEQTAPHRSIRHHNYNSKGNWRPFRLSKPKTSNLSTFICSEFPVGQLSMLTPDFKIFVFNQRMCF